MPNHADSFEDFFMPEIQEIIENTASSYGVSVLDIMSNRHAAPSPSLRKKISIEAHSEGFTVHEIAKALNKDRTTIIKYLKGK